MKTNHKPLDLEEFEKEIYSKIRNYIKENYEPKEFSDEWIEIFEDFETLDSELEIIKFIIKEIKQEIKKRCEFYLRYKDNPSLLWKENPKYRKKLKKFGITEKWVSEDCDELYDWEDYNEWLFKLAFKSVLE